jgi:hypothetical protein
MLCSPLPRVNRYEFMYMIQVQREYARSVLRNAVQSGICKTTLPCWDWVL